MTKPMDKKRSSKWAAFRRQFLKGKVCALCGGTQKLEAHHILPFHLHPELELDEKNLLPLCEGNSYINCHLFAGHLGNFKGFNPEACHDSDVWQMKLQENKARVKLTAKSIRAPLVIRKRLSA